LDQISPFARKLIRTLHDRKHRYNERMFIAEGEKTCADLLKSNLSAEFVIVYGGASEYCFWLAEQFYDLGAEVFTAGHATFEQLTDAKTPQGIFAVVKMPEPDMTFKNSFIALDGIADPGNVGTIIRTADWFGFKNIILSPNCADVFNPKTVRATMGSIFTMNLVYNTDLPEFLKEKPLKEIFGATLEAKISLEDCKPTEHFGLILGSESHGISENMRGFLKTEFIIPGSGNAESLNVGIAAGISLYHFSKFSF
jgi:TrmH family RNA methyltransferase